jgi:hypothetical protein
MLWLGLGASVLLFGYMNKETIITGVQDMLIPRGIRNNNPGNIRHGKSKWQGMAAQQTDAAFVQFISPEYGIRALSHILDSYAARGLNTVRKIINTFAPPIENDTGAYVQAVADALGVTPDTILSVANVKVDLVAAIIRHENGQQPYQIAQISNGVMMA